MTTISTTDLDMPMFPDLVWLVIAGKMTDHGWKLRLLSRSFRTLIEQTKSTIDLRTLDADRDGEIGNLIGRMQALSTVTISPAELRYTSDGQNWMSRDFTALARIVESIPNLTSLEVSRNNSCSGRWTLDLAKLQRLQRLALPDYMGINRNKDIGSLTALRELVMNQDWRRPAEDLAGLTTLTSLVLCIGFEFKQMNALSSLSLLRSLNLIHHQDLQCIHALTTLTCLTFLNLDYCRQLRSLDVLTSLSNLQCLSCIATGSGARNWTRVMTSAPSFTALRKLQLLDISLANNIYSLSSLACLTGLTKLWLDRMGSYRTPFNPTLTPISTLTNLRFLSLRDNAIAPASVDALIAAIPGLVVDTEPGVVQDLQICLNSWTGMRG